MSFCMRLLNKIPINPLGFYSHKNPFLRLNNCGRLSIASHESSNSEVKAEKENSDTGGTDTTSEKDFKADYELQIEALTKQMDEFKDKYTRALAETENVRQRMQKQVDEAKLFGIQGFCKDLLEVADILNKATESVPKEQLSGVNVHLNGLYDGLKLTENQLKKVFCKHGLLEINPPEGEKFNPNLHEALFEQPVEGKTPGTVALVSKIGYQLHTRTIRPALVGVVKE